VPSTHRMAEHLAPLFRERNRKEARVAAELETRRFKKFLEYSILEEIDDASEEYDPTKWPHSIVSGDFVDDPLMTPPQSSHWITNYYDDKKFDRRHIRGSVMEAEEDEEEEEDEDDDEEEDDDETSVLSSLSSSIDEDTGDDRAEFHEWCKQYTDKLDDVVETIEIVTDRKLTRRELIDHIFNAMLKRELRPPPPPKTDKQLVDEQVDHEGYVRGTNDWKKRRDEIFAENQADAAHREIDVSVTKQLRDEGVNEDADTWSDRYWQIYDARRRSAENSEAEAVAAEEAVRAEQRAERAAQAARERAEALAEAARVAAQPRRARLERPDYYEGGSGDDAGDDDDFVDDGEEEEEEEDDDDEDDEDYGGRRRRAAPPPRQARPRRVAENPYEEPGFNPYEEPAFNPYEQPPARLMRATDVARFGHVERTEKTGADPRPPQSAPHDVTLKWMLQNLEPPEWTDLQMVDYVQDPDHGLRRYPTSTRPINQLRERLYTKLRDPGLVDQEYEGDAYTGRYRWHYAGQDMTGWERGHA